MTNETKDLLMQYLFRFAEHYKIASNPALSFKKRNELLEKLQAAEPRAHSVISKLFEAFFIEDRIANDVEKKEKKSDHWHAEYAQAEKNKVEAEMEFVKFCRTEKIPVGGVVVEVYPENKL
jgi:hypothetical protein